MSSSIVFIKLINYSPICLGESHPFYHSLRLFKYLTKKTTENVKLSLLKLYQNMLLTIFVCNNLIKVPYGSVCSLGNTRWELQPRLAFHSTERHSTLHAIVTQEDG